MPSLVQVANNFGLQFAPDHGTSAVAASIARTQTRVSQRLAQPAYTYDPRAVVLRALNTIERECAETNWDGYDGAAVQPLVVANVRRVLTLLPFGFPMPDLCPEPDGEVGLEWGTVPEHSLSLSIGCGTRVAYAWVHGAQRGHGVATLNEYRVPTAVLHLIGVILGHGRTTFGAA